MQRLSKYGISQLLGLMAILSCSGAGQVMSATGNSLFAQSTVVREDTYRSVLDKVFPLEYQRSPKVSYVIVVRLEPSLEAETQLVIVVKDSGPITITRYDPVDGSIFSQLNKMLVNNEKEDPVNMAAHIRVKKSEMSLPRETGLTWYKSFFLASRQTASEYAKETELSIKTDSHEVSLDSTYYEVRFNVGGRQVQWRYPDVGMVRGDSSSRKAMTVWINTIRKAISHAQPE